MFLSTKIQAFQKILNKAKKEDQIQNKMRIEEEEEACQTDQTEAKESFFVWRRKVILRGEDVSYGSNVISPNKRLKI